MHFRRTSQDLLAKINTAGSQAQITFFLWFLAIVDIGGVGVVCLIMAPPSSINTAGRLSPIIVKLFRISPNPDESADALEVFGAAYVRDLPRIIGH